jgi:glycosyltransferase involved in cell wall biosynthesis
MKLGRGRAVKEAWAAVVADIYVYLDADMATNIRYLEELIESCSKGFDVATGSRYSKNSDLHRPFLRKVVSRTYNLMISILFGTRVKDHQCGFKAMSKRGCEIMLRESIFDDWFWDTEIFVIARRNNLTIHEFAVEWQEKRGNKTPILRLLKDIRIHGSGIFRLLTNNTHIR